MLMTPRDGIEAMRSVGLFIAVGVIGPPGSFSARRVSDDESENALVKGLGAGGVFGAMTSAAISRQLEGKPNQRSRWSGIRKVLSQ